MEFIVFCVRWDSIASVIWINLELNENHAKTQRRRPATTDKFFVSLQYFLFPFRVYFLWFAKHEIKYHKTAINLERFISATNRYPIPNITHRLIFSIALK